MSKETSGTAGRRKREILIASLVALILVAAGVVLWARSLTQPAPVTPASNNGSTVLYYSDGSVLADLGQLDRDTPTPTATAAKDARPVDLVVNHVLSELSHGSSPLAGKTWAELSAGGYQIHTTLNPVVQKALEASAGGDKDGSPMAGQPERLQAAAVLVEPGTGRVLGYYGGDGTSADYAGVYTDENDEMVGFGAHAPGATFFVHTLAAALKAGYSLNSYWTWKPHDMPGRTGQNQIRNASMCQQDRDGACSLAESTRVSLTVPMYGVTLSLGPAKVIEMARDAGIDSMWTDDHGYVDLAGQKSLTAVTPSKFDTTVGIGQYPVTVLDQANAMATYAAGGIRARAHFVAKVTLGEAQVYGETLPAADQPTVLKPAALADLNSALQSSSGALTSGASASKTGAWDGVKAGETTDAWMVGYTNRLAMAVWIGGKRDVQPLRDAHGETIWGSGLPSTIYRDVMNSVHTSMAWPATTFPPAANTGNVLPPGSVPR